MWAAAITATELSWDLSWTTRDGADRTPVIPSHEVSGIVVELGEGAVAPAVGTEVYGLIDFDRNGAAAEYVTVPAADLALHPRSVHHVDAAALPLAALTAWQALVDHARVLPGERVLVHGGAGGVGAYVIQLATLLGARVTATGTGAQAEFIAGLGASTVIDFTTTTFTDVVSDLDVVIDTVGGATLDASFEVIRPAGRLITLAAPPSQELADAHGITATFFVVRPDTAELTHLAELVDDGRLLPVVAGTFPFAEGRAAFEFAATQVRPGKTVLVVRKYVAHDDSAHCEPETTSPSNAFIERPQGDTS